MPTGTASKNASGVFGPSHGPATLKPWNLLRRAPVTEENGVISTMARRSTRSSVNTPPRSGGTSISSIRSKRRRPMQDNFTESRNLNSTAVPGLSDEAREAVNAAFDAMSTWRVEAAKRNEKQSQEVIETTAVAARRRGGRQAV